MRGIAVNPAILLSFSSLEMIVLPILVLMSWATSPGSSSTTPLTSTTALKPTFNSTNPPSLAVLPPANNSSPKRFVDAVYAEVLHMSILYPTASFVEAQLTSTFGPTTDPTTLTDVRLIFKIHGEDGFYTIFVQNTSWGGWRAPQIVSHYPPPQNGLLPSDLGMDILVADSLLKDAGYRQDYDAVDVRWPINMPIARQQVYYYFQMVGNLPSMVAVGAKDGSVIAQNSVEEG